MADPRPDFSLRTRTARQAGEGAAFSPLYRQIKDLLVQSLERGEWMPGELIPSEIDLAARFQVSQGTVRKAVDELAAEHMLLRRQGKGTFVATHHEPRVRYRFLRLAPDEVNEAGRAENHILDCRRLRAPAEIARALELRAGETVVSIRRQLAMNHAPVIIDDIWVPGASFRGLTLELLKAKRVPLYGLYESEFGVSMVRADEKIRAVAASEEVATLLHVTPGTPLLQVDRISYTYGDRPMEVRRGLYLTDHYHYRNSLN
ncbi:GntR family transcriptional regulator [Bordetella holmesii]|uniref:GntR family transcriptional regulator n=2 Tax=Bordetella holmesii TaxID=35814 RepID=UPI0002BAA397|nr:GntR family transcriptional regulator [Bordetella holmesii]AMD45939.1 GntR family transcriptional regulator [Bordetella holmesii H558]AMD48652.1 GntR family transcriptional regulator [Bordetella holmesii F627]AOB34828.1 GntR family transcriptional regulator [Bordetella holmesii]AUL18832.1 GntR family transcriptional regulator [Bordetella holmesii]AUL22151.1 GntR family transcriptional regulator [Bordetella holmesii]